MAKSVIQSQILSANGSVSVAPGSTISIRSNTTEGSLVQLWQDREGTTPQSNPFQADSDGFFRVYYSGGLVGITAALGGSERKWEHFDPGLRSDLASGGAGLGADLVYGVARVINVRDFGAVGDGVTDDTEAIQAAIDAAALLKIPVVIPALHKISGEIFVPSNSTIVGAYRGAGFAGYGTFTTQAGGAHDVTLEKLSFFGSIAVEVGSSTSSNYASDFYVKDIYIEYDASTEYVNGAFGCFATNRMDIDGVHVVMTGADDKTDAIKFAQLRNSNIRNLRASGNVNTGIACAGTTSIAQPALYRCRLSDLRVEKDAGHVNDGGDHGLYFIGAQECVFDGIYTDGDWGSGYSLKIRDSHDNVLRNVVVETLRVTADNNVIAVLHTHRNRFEGVNCGTLVLHKDAGGEIKDLVFRDLTVDVIGVNASIVDPVIFTGRTVINNTGAISLYSCEFIDADVSFTNMDDSSTYVRFGTLKARNTRFRTPIYVVGQDIDLINCSINGFLRQSSSGGEYDIDLHNVFVDGYLYTNSTTSRVINAHFTDVTFSAAFDTTAANNPDGAVHYRNVKFADRYFVTETQVEPPDSVSDASIAAVASAINTAGKVAGKIIWDSTNKRLMRASGSAAADPWDVVDGSASVTPA